ncbi:DEKNAAC100200 [Brettanomyces naardenensis]|uniref:protein-tyrosine-phosphatase n=1 Tax=Brettanomyces naardenensis TaxID=13370 RepID=A0A448YFT7_BRENA|nr:DEKNAAC100200 [Brettanomyces naardenensis]
MSADKKSRKRSTTLALTIPAADAGLIQVPASAMATSFDTVSQSEGLSIATEDKIQDSSMQSFLSSSGSSEASDSSFSSASSPASAQASASSSTSPLSGLSTVSPNNTTTRAGADTGEQSQTLPAPESENEQQTHSQTQSQTEQQVSPPDLTPLREAGDFNRSDAYPEGPVCVLDPNLFLYSEPTLAQMNEFDVIINVAQEIKDYSYQITSINLNSSKKIEYRFIPWTHSSRLVSDFPKLTQLIDESLAANKKVLIHCQCGISRSASLIMAYFMKVNRVDYNQAYNQLKQKAPLISPNLSLIYELMEWGQYLKRNNENDTIDDTGDRMDEGP